MLRAADLQFSYAGHPAVRDVSLDVPRGTMLGILGPNGSGKTTLLRLLAGTLRPQRGAVWLDGMDLRRLSRAVLARRVAVVPQETQTAFDYTVLEIVLMGRYPHLGRFELEGPRDLEIARDALRATGTAALEHRLFPTLSGGEKQRVIVASALAQLSGGSTPAAIQDPKERPTEVLLLDEPTSSLDVGYQLEIAAILKALQASRGLTVVVSTHDLNFAAGVCDRIVLLRDGCIVESGDTQTVLTAEAIRRVYDVEAEVWKVGTGSGPLVIPVRRLGRPT